MHRRARTRLVSDDVAHRPSFRSQTVHEDGSYALLRPRLLNISLSIHAEGQNNRHQGRTSCSQLKPDWSAEFWAEQRNVSCPSASHTHTYLTIERYVMNQNKPPQSAHQSNKLRIKRKKNSFATHGRLSVWDRTGLALLQKSRGDPERTAGLLISTRQQECGVCTLK